MDSSPSPWSLFPAAPGVPIPIPPSSSAASIRQPLWDLFGVDTPRRDSSSWNTSRAPASTSYRISRPTTAPQARGFNEAAATRHMQMIQQHLPQPPSTTTMSSQKTGATSGGVAMRRRLSDGGGGVSNATFLPYGSSTLTQNGRATALTTPPPPSPASPGATTAVATAGRQDERPYLAGVNPGRFLEEYTAHHTRPPSSRPSTATSSKSAVFFARAEALLSSAVHAAGASQPPAAAEDEQLEHPASPGDRGAANEKVRIAAKSAVARLLQLRREKRNALGPNRVERALLMATAASSLPTAVGRLDSAALLAISEHIDTLQRQALAGADKPCRLLI